MNNKEYRELKRKAEKQHQEAIKMADEQRIKKLNAIETVWRMEHPSRKRNKSVSENNAREQVASTRRASYGSLKDAVRESLQYVPEVFTKQQVRAALEKIAPDIAANCKESSLTGRLIRLCQEDIIDQERAGKGSRSSIYKLKKNTATTVVEPEIVDGVDKSDICVK